MKHQCSSDLNDVAIWNSKLNKSELNKWESGAQMVQFLSQQLSVPVTNVRLAAELPSKNISLAHSKYVSSCRKKTDLKILLQTQMIS